ncbi:MAG TPA: citrate synthase [Acidimicrobiales bacterium]|nr:citrate synthase [Acidimicrobiales bacterium]
MSEESITLTDNRSGKSVTVPIEHGVFSSQGVRELDPGLFFYDPAFKSTASCSSSITDLDGVNGILRFRGYPIEQLAEKSTFLEVAYLLINGELPTPAQYEEWVHHVTYHTYIHENTADFIKGFRYDAHPMGMLVSVVAALSTFYPESKQIHDPQIRMIQAIRLIAKMPTMAAFAYRHSVGLPREYPVNHLTYTGNFLRMMWNVADPNYEPNPVLAKALDLLFILHADHEQNCSTTTMRTVGSAGADPFISVAAAASALYGPLHGGANEKVIRMLHEIGDVKNVAAYVDKVKKGELKLQGFGHRVYKNYDPRARIIKKTADDVFAVTGTNPLLEIALKLEEVALSDDYFIERKLYPNVDFYSGLIYEAMGFPMDMFTVLFAIGRTPGWLAHWLELVQDPEQKIYRPRQAYIGPDKRDYVPIDQR